MKPKYSNSHPHQSQHQPQHQAHSFSKINHLALASILSLLCIPLFFWITTYTWKIDKTYTDLDLFFFLITESGSAPIYAALTSILFLITLISLYGKKINWTIIIFAVLMLQGGSQIAKTLLKTGFAEPRPYINALITQTGIDKIQFYQDKRAQRAVIVKNASIGHINTPQWLQHHWQAETGYSFPSGHAAFAISWLSIFIIFLSFAPTKRNIILTLMIGVWAGLMLISRVVLGMHFPIDLFASVILVYFISVFTCKFALPYFYGLVKK